MYIIVDQTISQYQLYSCVVKLCILLILSDTAYATTLTGLGCGSIFAA